MCSSAPEQKVTPSESVPSVSGLLSKRAKFERHKHGTLFIVWVAYFLDCLLITVVVPILPDYLTRLQATDEINRTSRWAHNTTEATVTDESDEDRWRSLGIGYIMCVKPAMQFVFNFVAGPLTKRIGYSVPMLAGFFITFLSTAMFVIAKSFWTLFTARAIQGVGSAFTAAAGMGMLAKAYNDDDQERGRAMGIALSGVSIGLMAGPPYGGFLYHWGGIVLPFAILAGLTLLALGLEVVLLRPRLEEQSTRSSSLLQLLADHQVVVTALSIAICNYGFSTTEPTIPLWLQRHWGVGPTLQGLVFLPSSVASAVCSGYFVPVVERMGRWLAAMLGMFMIAFCVLVIPHMPNYYYLLLPIFFLGWSVGMAQTAMFPTMGQIVDARHPGAYGTVYAIADSAICLAFVTGPFFSETMVKVVGFEHTLMVTAGINLAFAPFLLFLRRIKKTAKAPSVDEPAEPVEPSF